MIILYQFLIETWLSEIKKISIHLLKCVAFHIHQWTKGKLLWTFKSKLWLLKGKWKERWYLVLDNNITCEIKSFLDNKSKNPFCDNIILVIILSLWEYYLCDDIILMIILSLPYYSTSDNIILVIILSSLCILIILYVIMGY